MMHRFHFSKDCLIVPGSGDNNCSLTALGLIDNGQLGVSLGTSNTVLCVFSLFISSSLVLLLPLVLVRRVTFLLLPSIPVRPFIQF